MLKIQSMMYLLRGGASTVEERKLKLSEKEASTYVDQILKAMDQE
ncbi:hypothetical protein NXH64_08520 [Butyrivibrio fibrisolvens]|nr:hypothetical protein [Pseudobutyrivibrio ruminis]MDC7279543.1 hypothetical protein [Butyrivibrio fibrisolvens]